MILKKIISVIIIVLLVNFKLDAQEFVLKKKSPKIYHKEYIDFNKNKKKDVYEDVNAPLEQRIANLLNLMSLDEKTCQMATLYGFGRVLKDELPNPDWKNRIYKDGIGNIDEHLNGLAYHKSAQTQYSWPPSNHAKAINEVQRFFVEETRLGIPVDFTNEGIRGLCHDGATSFPAQIGIGSTWNKNLVSKIGEITGKEARALGYTNIYSPILDLARDPRWGRTVECYGEDPYLVSQLGLGMVQSLQAQDVVSTAKHFAVYSAPKGGRDGDVRTDPHITEREMHEIYLEPFRTVVQEGGLKGVMSSYNDYNGIPVSASHYFLTELLRDNWGFNGYVVSDSWAVGGLKGRHHIAEDFKETVYLSVMAGLNVRTNFTPAEDFILPLRELVNEGRIPMEIINERVKDVLRVKFELGLFDEPYVNHVKEADAIVHNTASEKIALQASRESLVLLKNSESLLPVDLKSLKNILVTGPNAKAINHSISRYGPSNIKVQSVYDGIKNITGNQVNVDFAQGCDFYDKNWPKSELYQMSPDNVQQKYIDEAVEKAKSSDLIVVAVGDNEDTVGESKSRTSLNLPGNQLDLVKALYETGKPIVVVLINGRPMSINWINDHISSVIEAWFPGEYGGQAIAETIFGLYNPGGKLPITFPRTVGQIPFNFPFKRSSQKGQGKEDVGQTRVNTALYPFGYGLSYTTFEYSDLKISSEKTSRDFSQIAISFKVKNTGNYKGDEVPQLYIQDEYASVVTYEKLLRGFERITLEPGMEKEITITLKSSDLSLLNVNMERVVEPGVFKVFVGTSSEDIRLTGEIVIN
ncbi:glycoside hydrolase family 3 N-terminal domain-containing protein [Aestuariibaculum sediminum]|uniref:Glycoside hydrolase family 3 C-terminal domain-containing protein n=1 Tax=Aestuariibaculum sediminum TaxID=2770637 RepID=A0A8J6UC27_9FLAO|nr:glycoside hydrolase family 3 N-terminal domain-containing protein [Aestuariibaculum sediminum]MBD0831914.1 glycoside hydrolase family 3 C-terminal domain-containing protein [Aestuariibaculum sediminum]